MLLLAAASLSACAGPISKLGKQTAEADKTATPDPKQRDCLVRAMYFESNRSSENGMMAVGTVVMNRVDSPNYPNTICEVVGQKRQFAPGVLTREMDSEQRRLADASADRILAGARYAPIGKAMYFHAASIRIPYKNIDYMTVAGGNAFYQKKLGGGRRLPALEPPISVASAKPAKPGGSEQAAKQAVADAGAAAAKTEDEAKKAAPLLRASAGPDDVFASITPFPGTEASFVEAANTSSSAGQGNVTQVTKSTR